MEERELERERERERERETEREREREREKKKERKNLGEKVENGRKRGCFFVGSPISVYFHFVLFLFVYEIRVI